MKTLSSDTKACCRYFATERQGFNERCNSWLQTMKEGGRSLYDVCGITDGDHHYVSSNFYDGIWNSLCELHNRIAVKLQERIVQLMQDFKPGCPWFSADQNDPDGHGYMRKMWQALTSKLTRLRNIGYHGDRDIQEKKWWKVEFPEYIFDIMSFSHANGNGNNKEQNLFSWITAVLRGHQVQEENWIQKMWNSMITTIPHIFSKITDTVNFEEKSSKSWTGVLYTKVSDIFDTFYLGKLGCRHADENAGIWKKAMSMLRPESSNANPTIKEWLMRQAAYYYDELLSVLSKQKGFYARGAKCWHELLWNVDTTPLSCFNKIVYNSNEENKGNEDSTLLAKLKSIFWIIFETVIRYIVALIVAFIGLAVIVVVMEEMSKCTSRLYCIEKSNTLQTISLETNSLQKKPILCTSRTDLSHF